MTGALKKYGLGVLLGSLTLGAWAASLPNLALLLLVASMLVMKS